MCRDREGKPANHSHSNLVRPNTLLKGLHEKCLGAGERTRQIAPRFPRPTCPVSKQLKRVGTKIQVIYVVTHSS